MLSRVWLLWPHELQHARIPCPSPSPWVCSNSRPLSQWRHATISSSVVPFSSCPQSFPASGSFLINQLLAPSSPRIGASASATVLPINIQGWFPLGLTGLISLLSRETLKSLLYHHSWKASILQHSAFFMVQPSHPYVTTEKIIALTIQTFVSQVISLLFNILSRFVIAVLPRSKFILISWLQTLSPLILEPKKVKSDTVPTLFLFICHEVIGPDAMILVFWMLSFKPTFSHSSLTFIKRLFSSSHFLPLKWYRLHIWGCWYFSRQSWF